jgi:hypothetical protein
MLHMRRYTKHKFYFVRPRQFNINNFVPTNCNRTQELKILVSFYTQKDFFCQNISMVTYNLFSWNAMNI